MSHPPEAYDHGMVAGHRLRCSVVVRQAQGMVSVQADCALPCALLRLETWAQQAELDLDQIALAVIEHRIRSGEHANLSLRPTRV